MSALLDAALQKLSQGTLCRPLHGSPLLNARLGRRCAHALDCTVYASALSLCVSKCNKRLHLPVSVCAQLECKAACARARREDQCLQCAGAPAVWTWRGAAPDNSHSFALGGTLTTSLAARSTGQCLAKRAKLFARAKRLFWESRLVALSFPGDVAVPAHRAGRGGARRTSTACSRAGSRRRPTWTRWRSCARSSATASTT